MACKYFYDNNEYTFDEFASLLESGLADELVAKNILSSSGVYNKKATVDTMPGAITINASNTNVPLGKGKNPLTTLARQAQRMVKALSKLSPDISFTIHATEESWNELKDQMLSSGTDISGMDGFYNPNTSQVHLNYPLMKELGRFNTGFHEGYHPLTNALFDSRPDLRNMMFDQLVTMSKDVQLSKDFRDQIKEVIDFGEQYREEFGPDSVMDESIVEFLSRVSSGQIPIDANNKSLIAHIKAFLNKLASMLNIGVMMGNKEYTVDNLLDFARAVDFAFKQGVAVDFDTRNVPTNNILNRQRSYDSVYQFSKAGTSNAEVNGKEVNIPEAVLKSNTGIANAIDFAKSKVFNKNIEFKEAIQDLFKKDIEDLKKQYGKNFKPEVGNKEFKEYLKDAYLNESLISLESHPSAIGWYDLKVKTTMDIMSLIHPELKTDKDMQDIFKIALAVTSNGNKVDDQFKETDRLYEDFKKNGKFDTSKSIGTQSKAIKSTLEFVNSALEQMSISDFSKFLTSMYRAGDLKYKGKDGKAKNILSGFVADQMVYGASVFGPKIGNGFFMNLYGEFGQLTMDRWFMRQYGRLTGRLIERSEEKINNAKKRLSAAIKNLSKDEKSTLSKVSKDLNDLSNLEDVALKINKASTKVEKRELLQSSEKLDEIRLAANSLTKELSGEIEAPKGGRERMFITEVINDVKDKLKKEYNIDISVADLQAINWYLEKALYNTSKSEAGEDSQDQLPDYEIAARNLAKQKYNISDETINETVSRTIADNGLNRPGNEVPNRDNQDAIVEKLKKDIISLKEKIESEKPESNKKKKKILPSLAGEFVNKLNETKASDPKQYWSVDTVSLEDAKQGTVIKTEAGYGFVSQSGDIKGVFKANKESSEKTGDEVLKKAVKAGGIKLDNFDGYLTKIYERNGFRIASRIPFNEEYAPDGWNKEAHGTPDVVAMVYDPAKQLDIEEKRFEDYMEGIDYRDSFVDLAYGNAVTNGAMPPRINPRPNDLVSASSIVYDMTEDGNGNYVFYTSNVSGKNADVDEDGMLNLSTEKGIQPSMVKVPYESTYPLNTNPLGLKGSEKEILQQAKNLGFAAVVDKDMEGNAVVMSDTVMPAEPVGTVQHASNKQTIQPSLGWGGSKGVQEIKVGSIARKSMAPVSPIKGNVKELSNRQQSAFFNNFRTFFSATQGNSQAAKSLQENLLGAKSEIINQIDKNAIELSKLVKAYVKSDAAKAAGLSQDTVHRIVNGAIIGETNPLTGVKFIDMLPQDLADAVVKARQNIVTLQEILVQTGSLPAEIEAVIATTIGSYSKRSFYAFELPKKKGIFNMFSKQKKSTWFESVPQDVRDRAREIFKAMAMNGTLDNGFNIALNDYKKNFEDPYLALIAVDPSMQSNATQQAAMAMNNALVDLQNKAGEFADAVMRRIEDVNQVGDVNFTIGGSVVSMKDYIEKNPALPREIREYLGEIKDPAINFRLTAMKLTRMLFNHQTVAQFKNLGLQTGDVVTASEPTPAGWIKLGEVTQAEVKGKKGTANDEMDALNRYGALKGCSITPALYDLLFDTPIEGTLYYKYITTNVKKFKTIYSPSTQIKNLYGYTFFGMTSGAIPEGLFYSAKIASAAYNQITTQDGFLNYWNEIFTEAKRRGINTSLEIEEINRVGRELSQNKELLRSLKGSNNPATEIYQYFTEMFTNTENVFKQGMALGDAIPKTIMFEVFRNTNAAILNGTSYYELDERQKELANEMASRKVKLTTVTDTRTIKGIDFIQRKMGIFGTFPRFLSESIRNFVNAHLLIVNPGMLHEGLILSDNKAKDAELKKQMDLKTRAAGMAGLAGYYGLMALLKAAISFGDDDDDKVNADLPSSALLEASQIYNKPKGTLTQSEALRMLVPEYDRFADLSFEIKKDGTIEYKNESSVDPFNVFPQAFRSYVYSDNIATGTANAVKQVVDPVIGWEIMFGTALEIINNENSKGAVIYKNYDDFADKASDALAYAFRKVGPGIATSSMRYKDLVNGGKREGGAFGYINFMLVEGSKGRVSTMEVEAKLKSKVSEINNSWIDDQRSYKGDFYKDKSEQERAKLNQERDNNAKMYAYELNQLVEAGYTLGLTTGQVKQVFKDARVSKKVRNAAMRGGSAIDKLNINDIKED